MPDSPDPPARLASSGSFPYDEVDSDDDNAERTMDENPPSAPEATSEPFEEIQDSVAFEKALTLLAEDTTKDPKQLFNARTSLHHLHLPYTTLPDPSGRVEKSSFRVKDQVLKDGCYLIYDPAYGGTLVLHYSHQETPENAVGFWAPGGGKAIQEFKFQDAGGYVELIRGITGGIKNKKKYLSGWCQFIQMAKSWKGMVKKYPNPDLGLKVDIYGFKADGSRVSHLDLDLNLVDVSDLDAVAVVPKGNDRFEGVHSLTLLGFLELGNLEGASLKLHD